MATIRKNGKNWQAVIRIKKRQLSKSKEYFIGLEQIEIHHLHHPFLLHGSMKAKTFSMMKQLSDAYLPKRELEREIQILQSTK